MTTEPLEVANSTSCCSCSLVAAAPVGLFGEQKKMRSAGRTCVKNRVSYRQRCQSHVTGKTDRLKMVKAARQRQPLVVPNKSWSR